MHAPYGLPGQNHEERGFRANPGLVAQYPAGLAEEAIDGIVDGHSAKSDLFIRFDQ